MNSNAPIAVDIDNSTPGLELVAGCRIYSVSINRGAMTATLTLTKEVPTYATRTARGKSNSTSVADFNQDGFLDVLAVGSDGAYNANTTIFFWDVQNNVVKKYIDKTGGGSDYDNGWINGAGRINIADIDGDTLMNAVYVSGKFLYALKESGASLDTLWRRRVTEETSGITGCTMFDFNADGKSEIVYRDEDYIYIYTTETVGTVTTVTRSTPVRCSSRTSNEYPIVVDMDGDGSTEICVTCSTTNTTNGAALGIWDQAEVRVYESANEPWVPARRVWNQHGYFVVNVNDNLTIPRKQQLHHLIYAKNAQCRLYGTSRPLNSFLNQSPYLNSFGCPSFPAPNLAVAPFSPGVDVSFTPPTCPVDSFEISFKIKNLGDIRISGDVKVSFYNGDPEAAAPLAVRLRTTSFPLGTMSPGDSLTLTTFVKGPGSAFRLYIVINDDGTTIPLDITQQPNRIPECEYDNIISTQVNPLPAPLIPELIRDNLKCLAGIPGAPTPADNGAVKAYVPIGTVRDSVNFNFYWSDGTTAKPIGSADHVGPTYSGLGPDTYTVYAVHKVVSCGSDTVTIDVGEIGSNVDARVIVEQNVDDCKNPNGRLKVVVNDTDNDGNGDPVGNFTYIWYDGPDILVGDTLGISHTLTGLSAGSYSVLVFDKATGCAGNDSDDILDVTSRPQIDTAHVDIDCSNAPTGVAEAWVLPAKTTAGHTFYWSNGSFAKPTEDFKGAIYQNRPAGFYTVVAENNASKCLSDTLTVRIKQTPAFVVSITSKTDQTSCDVMQPNGSAAAAVGGVTAGFTWEWFSGQNTLAANLIGSNPTIDELPVGIYTVKATDANGCFDTQEVTINFAVVPVNLLFSTKTNSSVCTPPNGSITVSVNPGTPADYKFQWYLGSTVKAVSDFPNDTLQTLTGLAPGDYTVIATFRSRHCTTNPITVNITDVSPPITFGVPVQVQPSDCNDNQGSLTIPISAAGNTAGFRVEWFRGSRPFAAAAFNTETIANNTSTFAGSLVAGMYTIVVENLDTHCFTEQAFPLNYLNSQILTFLDKLPVNTCDPANEGRIRVRLEAPAGFTGSDFTIFVYAGANDPVFVGLPDNPIATIPGVAGVTTNYSFGPPLGVGEYTFVAVNSNPLIPGVLGCRSVPVIEEIEEVTENPSFTAGVPTVNMNCDGTTGTAQITLTMAGPTGNPADYDFNWFEGTTTAGAALGTTVIGAAEGGVNGEIAVNLKGGFYTVQVIKRLGTGANAGCDTTATFQVFDNPPIMSLAQADIDITSVTRCDLPTMGSVTVNSVSENGIAVPVVTLPTPNYTFEWFSENPVAGGAPVLIPGETTNVLTGRPAGKYFVRPTGTTNLCSTGELMEFIIESDTTNTVLADLIDFSVPSVCLKPANEIGELSVLASGNSTTGYTYNWFEGQNTSVPLGTTVGNTSGADGEIATNLIGGFYTVQVINNDTRCEVFETYELPVDTALIFLNASASPLTFCLNPNGAVYAIVTSADKDLYAYEWYAGTAATPPVASPPPTLPTGRSLPDQPDGVYLVVATDLVDANCVVTDTVTVEDLRVFPVVTAVPLNPMTNCDDTKPNGTAFASVGGNIIDYEFNWFGEILPTDTIATSSQISGLADSTYTVIAQDIVTGCRDTTQVTINFVPAGTIAPTIEIISHVTSCVEDNGALSVSVDGNISDYIFEWYNGTVEKPSPDFVGVIYDSLAVGIYSVRATSKITGCVSPLVSEEILFQGIDPQFTIDVVPAPCDTDQGQIYLTITNNVEIDTILWEMLDGSGNVTGEILGDPVLQGIPAGKYRVTVVTQLGCSASQDVELKSEIHPFNGISRNGDGKNEYFHINCIGDFEDNIVKIYNRAGTLVYEHEGYNNIDIFFDGKSNKGISMMGTNLPDGTYFYVIDKRDGSKPVAGYLEIVN